MGNQNNNYQLINQDPANYIPPLGNTHENSSMLQEKYFQMSIFLILNYIILFFFLKIILI